MKPWLFDILACPLDKNFPLKLYVFSFETPPMDFKSFIEVYEKRDLDLIRKEEIIKISQEDNNFLVSDNIVIEKTEFKSYLASIKSSIDELQNVYDNTRNTLSKECFTIIKTNIKKQILDFDEDNKPSQIEDIFPELYFLNKIKMETEIESGILFCSVCNRWYPIIETIPQMLPDEYRNREKEIEFLKNNKNLLDEDFLNQKLKPYNL
ncbi:MAG: Trm112 family protein [Promethearchaeota archaeon]|jgi:uncharacterized protein YbaR (Trm112 family)